MANLNLLQRRRRDGTMALTGKSRSPEDPDRGFPDEYDFSLVHLGPISKGDDGTDRPGSLTPASFQGDEIHLDYVNAKARYKVTHTNPDGTFHGTLIPESVEIFDAPPVDQDKVAELEAAKAAAQAEAGSTDKPKGAVAHAGAPKITPADEES